jgi:hypothetical protein
MVRRVGSDSAANTASRAPSGLLTMWFNVAAGAGRRKTRLRKV